MTEVAGATRTSRLSVLWHGSRLLLLDPTLIADACRGILVYGMIDRRTWTNTSRPRPDGPDNVAVTVGFGRLYTLEMRTLLLCFVGMLWQSIFIDLCGLGSRPS